MRNKLTKSLVLLLCCAMILPMGACSGGKGEETKEQDDKKQEGTKQEDTEQASMEGIPEYLNVESAYPVIKDEYAGEIVLKVAVVQDSTGGEWNDLWISRYLEEKYNLKFEVESILSTALADRKSLMFSAGELPDIMLNMGLTTTEVVKYGQKEGMLLRCDEYMNETLTPVMYKYFQDENVKKTTTAPDGHVYALPAISEKENEAAYPRLFINEAKLKELGINEIPQTLDGFVDALYAAKEADPNSIPLAGGMESYGLGFYFLNAFGYLTTSNYGVKPAMRDGEVVIPAYDTEVYKEYLALMNQFYNDGIINSNYFTMENTETVAQMGEKQNLVFRDPVYTIGVEEFNDWSACYPLTSEWQDKQEWMMSNYVTTGNFAISADTEYPELCMRFAEIYFNNETDDPYALWLGFPEGHEYNYDGVTLEWVNEDGSIAVADESMLPDGVDLWTYLMRDFAGFSPSWGTIDTYTSIGKHYEGSNYDPKSFDTSTGEGAYRASVDANLVPYAVDGYPYTYYLDEETNNELMNLSTVIEPYIKEQVALFITGQRSLDEVDDFKKELEDMNIQKMLDIYKSVVE